MVTWGLIVTAAFVLFPGQISSLFFHEPEVLEIAVGYMIIIGIGEAFMCVEMLTISALSGLGQTKICSIISILLTGARIPLALVLTKTALGLTGIWWALTLSSMAKGIVFYFAFIESAKNWISNISSKKDILRQIRLCQKDILFTLIFIYHIPSIFSSIM